METLVTYIGYARFRHRGDQPYLSLCNSDDEGAFPIYRHPKAEAAEYEKLKSAIPTVFFKTDAGWWATVHA